MLYCILVCGSGVPAAEDLLHLPHMLHNPSAQAARFNSAVLLRMLMRSLKSMASIDLPWLLYMLHTCAGPQSGCIVAQANCCCLHAAGNLPWRKPTAAVPMLHCGIS